jgi:hypothetical protein
LDGGRNIKEAYVNSLNALSLKRDGNAPIPALFQRERVEEANMSVSFHHGELAMACRTIVLLCFYHEELLFSANSCCISLPGGAEHTRPNDATQYFFLECLHFGMSFYIYLESILMIHIQPFPFFQLLVMAARAYLFIGRSRIQSHAWYPVVYRCSIIRINFFSFPCSKV